MLAVLVRQRQQLLFLVPVEGLVVLFGFEAAFFQCLVQVDFFIGQVVQAVTGEIPQQIPWNQVGDLRITGNDLSQDVLAQVLAFDRIDRQ
ncbi:hypothetical protein D3C73_1280150 [compost metagenome]